MSPPYSGEGITAIICDVNMTNAVKFDHMVRLRYRYERSYVFV